MDVAAGVFLLGCSFRMFDGLMAGAVVEVR
jgi:hypothetical protein